LCGYVYYQCANVVWLDVAQHYGFTDEELDFIINYDSKYRMGGSSDTDDEE